MRKEEFMKQLETLLADISEEEKREALSYYWSYFDDAGEENEERILRELESPEKVAATIKDDLKMDQGADSGAYTERGFEDTRFQKRRQEIDIKEKPVQEQGGCWEQAKQKFSKGKDGADEDRTLKIVLIVIAIVLTSPIWLSILNGVVSVIAGLLGVVVGFIGVAFALYITGGVLFGVGIGEFAVGGIAAGFALLGAALLVWAFALLITVLCVWICGKGLPWLWRAIVKLWKEIFPGKERAI